jgi:SAM-dependent methyltransferase
MFHAAAKAWAHIGPPLRPSKEDELEYYRLALPWMVQHGAPRILILGVTPEIYGVPWPQGHRMTAADHTPAMIEHVWPGPREDALLASWLDLPLAPGSCDLAFTDGGPSLLEYPGELRRLADQLHKIVVPGGLCIFRLFAPPAQKETTEAVLADLQAGRIKTIDVLKMRLVMSMLDVPQEGVAMKKAWQRLRDSTTDWESLAAHLGWPLEYMETFDAWKGLETPFRFTSVESVAKVFCEEGKFVLANQSVPTYPLGECCPFVVFRRQ